MKMILKTNLYSKKNRCKNLNNKEFRVFESLKEVGSGRYRGALFPFSLGFSLQITESLLREKRYRNSTTRYFVGNSENRPKLIIKTRDYSIDHTESVEHMQFHENMPVINRIRRKPIVRAMILASIAFAISTIWFILSMFAIYQEIVK